MSLLFFILPLLSVGACQTSTNSANQTDLQAAMADMRTWSYHGFVILLKILNGNSNLLRDREITFFMPSDEELSKFALSLDNLQDFIFSHSIPTALMLSHLLHFPNGTLVPSCIPNRMLNVTNSGKSGLFINNAKIITPNVCLNSVIRCHGISTTITFRNIDSSPGRMPDSLLDSQLMSSSYTNKQAKPSCIHTRNN